MGSPPSPIADFDALGSSSTFATAAVAPVEREGCDEVSNNAAEEGVAMLVLS